MRCVSSGIPADVMSDVHDVCDVRNTMTIYELIRFRMTIYIMSVWPGGIGVTSVSGGALLEHLRACVVCSHSLAMVHMQCVVFTHERGSISGPMIY